MNALPRQKCTGLLETVNEICARTLASILNEPIECFLRSLPGIWQDVLVEVIRGLITRVEYRERDRYWREATRLGIVCHIVAVEDRGRRRGRNDRINGLPVLRRDGSTSRTSGNVGDRDDNSRRYRWPRLSAARVQYRDYHNNHQI